MELVMQQEPGQQKEQRVFTRIPFAHAALWSDGRGEHGTCELRDVSRGGLSVSLGRYLRPGPVVEFRIEDIEYMGKPVSFAALVAWCRADAGDPERFDAGFRVVYGEQETLGAMSEVFYRALWQADFGGKAPVMN